MVSAPQLPHRPAILRDSELTTAILRVTAGAAMIGLYLLGSLSDPYEVAGPALAAASLYSVGALVLALRLSRSGSPYPQPFTASLTVLDNGIILGLAWLTGGVTSPIVAILLLVITTTAARYGVRTAVACAVADSIVLFGVGGFADGPGPLHERLHLAGWWSWLLVGGAVIAGITARAAFEYQAQLINATHQGAVDRYERTLADQALRELEVAAADRREFLRVITHELRTPITSVAALARALDKRDNAMTAEHRHEALALLQSHAAHLQDLLDSVRDLATEQPGETRSLRLSDVDIEEVVTSSASAALLPRERLRLHLGDDVRLIRSDREKLRRILTNLLENAGRHSLHEVDVEVGRHGDNIAFEIRDRGPGMSDEIADHVFEKGFTFGHHRDSSGLGLWIVSELVRALGGTVSASPRSGGGLTMTVTLPVLH